MIADRGYLIYVYIYNFYWRMQCNMKNRDLVKDLRSTYFTFLRHVLYYLLPKLLPNNAYSRSIEDLSLFLFEEILLAWFDT